MNDPNGPFYDEMHGMYHLFYQDHLWAPMPDNVPTGREGPVWGHAVSRDMVHWAHMPVGMWNGDSWYDMHGLYTGSATIVEELGGPVLVFPGVCDLYPPGSAGAAVPGCQYGYAFGMAVPANRSDPLLRHWKKTPIVNDTFDDPSTAWKTLHGEWRMIGHCGDGKVGDCGPHAPSFEAAPIWASRDFLKWRRVGFTNLPAGECASLYPLPPLVDGTVLPSANDVPLTHVHKWGCGWTKDCYSIGSWVDGRLDSEPGVWTTAPSSPPQAQLERGIHYAVKDFWDAKHGRRIDWGWAPLYTSSLSLPRNVEYDPRLEQLVFAPLAEQALLRNGTLGMWNGTLARAAKPLHIKASAQSEVKMDFEMPSEAVRFVVNFTATLSNGSSVLALSFHIDYTPPPAQLSTKYHTIKVTGISTATPPSEASNQTEEGYPYPWVFTDDLPLVPGERSLRLRLFFDHTIAEAYWQERVAMTLPLSEAGWQADQVELLVLASEAAPIVITNATVWSVGSLWVAPQQVIDGGDHI